MISCVRDFLQDYHGFALRGKLRVAVSAIICPMEQDRSGKRFRDVVGTNIANARKSKGMTQLDLAAKLQIKGCNIGLSKIEHHVRSVFDYELSIIAHVLKVPVESLYPSIGEIYASLDDLKDGHRS